MVSNESLKFIKVYLLNVKLFEKLEAEGYLSDAALLNLIESKYCEGVRVSGQSGTVGTLIL